MKTNAAVNDERLQYHDETNAAVNDERLQYYDETNAAVNDERLQYYDETNAAVNDERLQYHDETNTAVNDERLQYQDIVTNKLKTKLNALRNGEIVKRAANYWPALVMQQDSECDASSSTCGDAKVVNSCID
jgi:hypothetical protein